MTAELGVSDIEDYLRGAGWHQRSLRWRGASIWTHGGHDVLVPARDGMGDGDLRVREILDVLAEVEDRAPVEIGQDIGSVPVDRQQFRFGSRISGITTLRHAIAAVLGVNDTIRAAAHAVFGDRHGGGNPTAVERFLSGVQVGAGRAGSYIVPVRVPLGEADGPGPPPGRLVTRQLHGAVSALSDPDALPTGTALSPDLCDALGSLSDRSEDQPFEIGFGWSRRLPVELPPATYRFEPGAGDRLRAAAEQLRSSEPADEVVTVAGAPDFVSVTGLVPRLDRDHWAIDVSADRPLPGTLRRRFHVRLPDRRTYEAAIVAHQQERRVRVQGAVTFRRRRTELHVLDPTGFTVLDPDSQGAS
ncbi:hypothetical protein [Amycolatopsis sp. PS_44_ISF1]|uniref:hypothetical protein n=1 Tax=Amycolatopsis sp. PS_44_ISF1 TaxID=2974917 RepID=UPI0028DE9D5F|nr:hypothetical protein [Amycolatopsis sp. PS_44_ISF1]MDT8915065.1 hypothetical protein [Amycolatopsis sp. PS_44_ISF1]